MPDASARFVGPNVWVKVTAKFEASRATGGKSLWSYLPPRGSAEGQMPRVVQKAIKASSMLTDRQWHSIYEQSNKYLSFDFFSSVSTLRALCAPRSVSDVCAHEVACHEHCVHWWQPRSTLSTGRM